MTGESNTMVFDQNANEYDRWFEKHNILYQSELLAVSQAVAENKKGIEIGTGTGRFSQPLNIKTGVEPSSQMASIAEQKGIKIYKATAENLPLENETFDFALMVTTDCFLSDIPKAFSETYRILKPNGEIIIGLIDKNSALGRKYEQQKSTKKFYKDAHFHSTVEITHLLQQAGFHSFSYWQTLTQSDLNEIEQPQQGFGKGSFIVIKAIK